MQFGFRTALGGALMIGLAACGGETTYKPDHFKAGPSLGLAKALSADEMQGRAPGTDESKAARDMIIDRMKKLGVSPVDGAYEHPFKYGPFIDPATGEEAVPDKPGTNILGVIPGSSGSGLFMIVTAHFDHLGVRDGEIYNGMDDNASGVVGILAVAEHFTKNQPKHDVLIVALDAEEDGFGGAREFIANPPIPVEQMAFNLNLDMISRGDNNILWASGASHWPALKPMIEGIAVDASIELKMGFDTGEGRNNWTMASDHGVFFRAGVPHLYLGVEDHPDYHKPSDDFERVDQDWFLKSVDTVVSVAIAADEKLDEIAAMKSE